MIDKNIIGKTMDETMELDWLGYWPIIDEAGTITGIVEADNVPDDAVLVDWENGKAVQVDGTHGFDAVLEN